MNFTQEFKLRLIRDIELDIVRHRKSFSLILTIEDIEYHFNVFSVTMRETKNLCVAFSARIMIENKTDDRDVAFLFHEFEIKFNHLSGEW